MIQLVLLHSLARVFPDRELPLSCKKTKGSMLKNEVYSFQLAYCGGEGCGNIGVQVKLDHDLGKAVSWRAVECVPCDFTMYPHYHDCLLYTSWASSTNTSILWAWAISMIPFRSEHIP